MIQIDVEGMRCEGCEKNVEEALKKVEGVENAVADRQTDSATVEGEAEIEDLITAVKEAGYTPSP
ncbi:MAG: heavy metal-associated domain-containing protein [Halobacteria archaeon]|nr:heavy metal-associated domain-containing protein [Halobacteria archaeon]